MTMQNDPNASTTVTKTGITVPALKNHALIGKSETIPVSAPTPVSSLSPMVLPIPGRAVDLQMRVSAPITGDSLPLILLSHGHGASNNLSSLHGYGPLADFYAAHGFVVIQPTHLNSKTLSLDPNGPEGALFWKSRGMDMHLILDHLDQIEAAVPGLGGRLDRSRIAAVGHSLGGHTVGMLAGMQVTDPVDGKSIDLSDARVTACVLLGAPGNGADLAPEASQRFPVLGTTNFAQMTTPALVVAGDKDAHPFFSARADWRSDAYSLSPSPKCLLTLFGGGHSLGGVSGYDASETTDESPERVALVQRLSWAYLRTALYPQDAAWSDACRVLTTMPEPLGRVNCK